MSLSNLLWTLGLVGVMFTAWPALGVLLGPLLAALLAWSYAGMLWVHAVLG